MFIDEPIEVFFETVPLREKKPPCPAAFEWGGVRYQIISSEQEWVDFNRKGRFARNMSDAHLATSAKKGSLGVGRFYFQVATSAGERFVIYYDRAPTKQEPKGSWVLLKRIDWENESDGRSE
ncbi:MAG TPA: DUF6504 family protein [Anaerolineales bacterium]|nr:DUF6504 family protein [Anaerolineales bacterium]